MLAKLIDRRYPAHGAEHLAQLLCAQATLARQASQCVVELDAVRWLHPTVDAFVEPAWHDNRCEGATVHPPLAAEQEFAAIERNGLTVGQALAWAQTFPVPIHLYLYAHAALPLAQNA